MAKRGQTPNHGPRSTARRLLTGLVLGLLAGLMLIAMRGLPVVENIELALVDLRTRQYVGIRSADPRIVLMQVQESDVAYVQGRLSEPWPWRLELNAALVRLLAAAGADVLVLDLYHFDRGAGPDDRVDNTSRPAERQRLALEAQSAETYRAALRELGKVALAFELSDTPKYELPARAAAAQGRLGPDGLAKSFSAYRRSGANLPVRRVIEGASLLGFANVPPDADGIVRRSPTLGRWGEHSVISLPLATAMLASGTTVATDDDGIALPVHQPLMADGSYLINYRGPPRQTYPRISPARVLGWANAWQRDGKVPETALQALAGKIVVFGVNLAGIKDIVSSPLAGNYDGVEQQATAIDNLLHGDGRVRLAPLYGAVLLLVIALLAGLATALPTAALASLGIAVLMMTAYTAAAFAAFAGGLSLDLFTPLLAVLISFASVTIVGLRTEGRYNRWLSGTFSRYLAPSVIETLKQEPERLELGGRRREITVLFSDVAGFTNLSERLTPEQVVELLNRYLTLHGEAIHAEKGVIDKFEGDAVMAFFGDPLPDDCHALNACRAALGVLQRLPQLEPVWRGLGLQGFDIRIGLNTGEAIVGNMGSEQRFDYTCMGDSVNLASRLEGANKVFGSRILIGAETFRQSAEDIVAKPLGEVVVVGRSAPVAVYELLALREQASAELLAHAESFARAIDCARSGRLDDADAALEVAESACPDQPSSRWLREQLAAARSAGAWSGVTRLDSK